MVPAATGRFQVISGAVPGSHRSVLKTSVGVLAGTLPSSAGTSG